MDIGRALTFFTEEDRWIEKTTIGALVVLVSSLLSFLFVGVVGFFILMGYGLRLMNNVRYDVRPVLPEWDQWGEDLNRGFKLFVVSLVWSLPVFVVVLPSVVGGAMLDSGGSGAEAFGLMLVLCGTCLSFVYALFLAVVQPGYTVAFARDEQIRSGLDFTSIWQWSRAHLSDVVVVAIVYVVGSLVISMVAGLIGVVACVIGLLVTLPLGTVVVTYFQYHLYGQLARDGGLAGARVAGYSAGDPTDVASSVVVSSPVATSVEPKPVDVSPGLDDVSVGAGDVVSGDGDTDTADDPDRRI